ncbi:unnamed protein product, partial [marine sediment metagenome]
TGPYLTNAGSDLTLKWNEGIDSSLVLYPEASRTSGGNSATGFYVDQTQSVRIQTWLGSSGVVIGLGSNHGLWETDETYDRGTGTKIWGGGGSEDFYMTLDEGHYVVDVDIWYVTVGSVNGGTKATHTDHKFNRYTRTSTNLGQSWGSASGPDKVDGYSTGPRYIYDPEPTFEMEGTPPFLYPVFVYPSGTKIYEIYGSSSDLYYRKAELTAEHRNNWLPVYPSGFPSEKISWSSSAQITHTGTANKFTVTICKDSSENVYAAWLDTRDGNDEIYYQKLPINFAPINGSITASMIKIPLDSSLIESQALSEPELLSPADGSTVKMLRPTFKWQGPKGITQYRLELSQLPTFGGARTFTKNITAAEANPTDGSNPTLAYEIHEFDEGLSSGTWY